MQKIIITTDCEEDVILRVLQGLKQGTVELPDGAGGMEPMGCCTSRASSRPRRKATCWRSRRTLTITAS